MFIGLNGTREVYTDDEPCAWCHDAYPVCYMDGEPMCFDCAEDRAADIAEQAFEDALEDW